MLPVYLLGNLHCIGMCGPLVMMIGHHRFRYFYFLGRTASFGLAAMLAAEIGSLMHQVLTVFHLAQATAFLFGTVMIMIACFQLTRLQLRAFGFAASWVAPWVIKVQQRSTLLLLQDRPIATFAFGLSTVLLPCGQTLVVFTACALAGSSIVGLFNGCAFALLTTPSLFLAMKLRQWMNGIKRHYRLLMGVCTFIVGVLMICRGFADLGVIPHLILNQSALSKYHIVIY